MRSDIPAPNFQMADLPALVGQTLGHSDWITVDQARVDAFAHGFLTLVLLPLMSSQAYDIPDATVRLNYGLNKLRFSAPVPVGSRLREHFKLISCAAVDQG